MGPHHVVKVSCLPLANVRKIPMMNRAAALRHVQISPCAFRKWRMTPEETRRWTLAPGPDKFIDFLFEAGQQDAKTWAVAAGVIPPGLSGRTIRGGPKETGDIPSALQPASSKTPPTAAVAPLGASREVIALSSAALNMPGASSAASCSSGPALIGEGCMTPASLSPNMHTRAPPSDHPTTCPPLIEDGFLEEGQINQDDINAAFLVLNEEGPGSSMATLLEEAAFRKLSSTSLSPVMPPGADRGGNLRDLGMSAAGSAAGEVSRNIDEVPPSDVSPRPQSIPAPAGDIGVTDASLSFSSAHPTVQALIREYRDLKERVKQRVSQRWAALVA